MQDTLSNSLTLVDVSGYLIILAIIALLTAALFATAVIRLRYLSIERDLSRHSEVNAAFSSRLLNHIAREALQALRIHPSDVNTQAIIDHSFHTELRWVLVAERFVKASTGLLIILGLVGTFYGLTLSIGKLVSLISSDVGSSSEVTETLTRGLTEALTGMSVAFSTSLFGILAAIVMTLVGVFFNVSDLRTALIVRIEAFVDNTLLASMRAHQTGEPQTQRVMAASGDAGPPLGPSLSIFDQSVSQLSTAVAQFEHALTSFSSTTRDFREFNLHLKDNVQRMSLGFGDLSETLKEHAARFKERP